MRGLPFFIGTLFIALLSFNSLYATHFKAGEITVKWLGGANYQFTLTTYLDSNSINDAPDLHEKTAELIVMGGQTEVARFQIGHTRVSVGNGTWKYTYVSDPFTVPNRNVNYTVYYQKANRNAGIENITNSVSVAFSVQTTFYASSNSTPLLKLPPIDQAAAGRVFTHNPLAYDSIDGDSISFRLIPPRANYSTDVSGYRSAADPGFNGKAQNGGPGTISIDPVKGDLVWDSPSDHGIGSGGHGHHGDAALYNVAIEITEWRKLPNGNSRRMSVTVRDMQIEVKKIENKPPKLTLPKDTCIVAGTLLRKTIKIDDPDKDEANKVLQNFEVFVKAHAEIVPPATFKLNNPIGRDMIRAEGSGVFSWQTTLNDVRDNPYIIVFKAEDNAGLQKLSDIRSWAVKVVGPKPTGLKVTPENNSFKLSWDNYGMSTLGMVMNIYRKECDTNSIVASPCGNNMEALGYKLVGTVPITDQTYVDSEDLNFGKIYCYIIVAKFKAFSYGESLPSDQQCGVLTIGAPLLTNVSIEKTDALNGQIMVKWFKPRDLNTLEYPEPYKYRIYRTTGLNGAFSNTPIAEIEGLEDTTFIDSGINTLDEAFRYVVKLVYGNNQEADTTSSASSIFVSAKPGDESAVLQWQWNVPWENAGKLQYIYRKKENEQDFTLVDSLVASSGGGNYFDRDTSLYNDTTYCYYILTKGDYCRGDLPSPFLNKSQIVCVTPVDSMPPCPPTIYLVPFDCGSQVEDPNCQNALAPSSSPILNTNILNWVPDNSLDCNVKIAGYKLYIAPREGAEFELLKTLPDTFFLHKDDISTAGCYYVKAYNKYNIESERSNIVCTDICAEFQLPNLFTPDGDGKNDIFRPYPCVRGVENVEFSVYNRWGGLVYRSVDKNGPHWNGAGASDGVYYYSATVKFARRLKEKDETKVIKGWIHLLNGNKGKIAEQ